MNINSIYGEQGTELTANLATDTARYSNDLPILLLWLVLMEDKRAYLGLSIAYRVRPRRRPEYTIESTILLVKTLTRGWRGQAS